MSAPYPFSDPISGELVVLYVDDPIGVEHGDCPERAEVSPELDCFWCTKCHWNGRISGAWFVDVLGDRFGEPA